MVSPELPVSLYAYSSALVQGCTFERNWTEGGFSGAIDLDTHSSLNATNSAFNRNASAWGGAISATNQCSLTISGTQFTANTAGLGGGVLYLQTNPLVTVTNCTAADNAAGEVGGFAYCATTPLSLQECTFTNNVASNPTVNISGGLLYLDVTSPLLMHDCSVSGSAADEGGAIWVNDSASPVTLQDSDFTRCFADFFGIIDCVADLSIDGCTFAHNQGGGSNQAGVVHFNDPTGKLTLTNSQFTDNQCPFAAWGIVYVYADSAQQSLIQGCTFARNLAETGGGIYVGDGKLNILNCTFTENHVEGGPVGPGQGGGAIYWISPDPGNILHCTFTGNSAASSGGALSLYNGGTGIPVVEFNDFDGNMSYSRVASPVAIHSNTRPNPAIAPPGQGGAIYSNTGASPIIRHNTFCRDSCDSRGGALFVGDSATVENDSFTDSFAVQGGNVFLATSTCTIRNSIVAFAGSGGGIYFASGIPTVFSYNDVFGNRGPNAGTPQDYLNAPSQTGLNGNISVDPLFADRDNCDLHEKSEAGRWNPATSSWVIDPVTSKTIDAGDPGWPFGAEPQPNGGRINQGAFGDTEQASKTAPKFRPDLLIKKAPGSGAFVGLHIYNATGQNQTKSATTAQDVTVIYAVKILNAGTRRCKFLIEGPHGDGEWQVVYRDPSGNPITGAVTGAGWQTPNAYNPGQSLVIHVEVTPEDTATVGDSESLLITGQCVGDPADTVDAVKAVTTVEEPTPSGLQVTSLTALPTNGGAQIVFNLSADATATVTILNVAGRPIRQLVTEAAAKAGTNSLIWNAMSDQGLRAPNGTYLVRVVAHTASGQTSSVLTQLRLGR